MSLERHYVIYYGTIVYQLLHLYARVMPHTHIEMWRFDSAGYMTFTQVLKYYGQGWNVVQRLHAALNRLDYAECVIPVVLVALQLVPWDIGKLFEHLLRLRSNVKQPV